VIRASQSCQQCHRYIDHVQVLIDPSQKLRDYFVPFSRYTCSELFVETRDVFILHVYVGDAIGISSRPLALENHRIPTGYRAELFSRYV